MANLAVNKITGLWKTTYETVVQVEVAVGSQTSNRLYVLSQGKDASQMDILSADCNRDAVLYNIGGKIEVMHNMYDMNDIWYHNQAARRHRYPYETQHDYQHIYRRPDDQTTNGNKLDAQLSAPCKTTMFSLACAGNTLYGLDNLATFGHSFVNEEMYRWLLNDNGWPYPPTKLLVASLYTAGQANVISDAIKDTSAQYFTEEQVSAMTSSAGIYALSGIVGMKWNTIYEIPGNIKQDYSKGELIANTFKAKNQFDGNDWSMKHDTDKPLTQTREYLGIYSCGGQIWLKWKDYKSWETSPLDIDTYPDMYGKIAVTAATDVQSTIPFPQIETIAAINRGVQAPAHKSTLYSLKLRSKLPQKMSTMLDETSLAADVKSEIKEKLKLELQICMRKIAESIAPANCQMFSSTVDG